MAVEGATLKGHEGHDPLTTLNLPTAVHAQALKLLTRIVTTHTASECERAADRAEGFVLGLETVKALNAASAEALYLVTARGHHSRISAPDHPYQKPKLKTST